jgi:hypothetical protein
MHETASRLSLGAFHCFPAAFSSRCHFFCKSAHALKLQTGRRGRTCTQQQGSQGCPHNISFFQYDHHRFLNMHRCISNMHLRLIVIPVSIVDKNTKKHKTIFEFSIVYLQKVSACQVPDLFLHRTPAPYTPFP